MNALPEYTFLSHGKKQLSIDMSKAKYQKGEQITSLDELLGCKLVYLEDKVQCAAWFGCWRLKDAMNHIKNGHLYRVERR